MNDASVENPNGKILFGVDYLYFMRNMEIAEESSGKNEREEIVDAVIKLFLLQWGFSVAEIDQSNRLFWKKAEEGKLEETVEPALDRIIKFIKDDREKQELILVELTCIGFMDAVVSEREKFFANLLQEEFDLKPSEYNSLVQKGIDWAKAFDYLGKSYVESKINL